MRRLLPAKPNHAIAADERTATTKATVFAATRPATANAFEPAELLRSMARKGGKPSTAGDLVSFPQV
jgi:hypothetical protein